MTKVKIPNFSCGSYDPCVSDSNVPIQFQDEGVNLGTSGTISIMNFVGAAVTAVRSGSTLTITITGGGSGSYQGNYNNFESDGFGTLAATADVGDMWRLVFADPNTPQIVGGVEYVHNTIIQYTGSNTWNSWSINNGGES